MNKKNSVQNLICLTQSFKEIKEVEKILGWRVFHFREEEINKTLIEKNEFKIIELRNNERIYVIKEIPELTVQEAELIQKILNEFQVKEIDNPKIALIENTLQNYCEKNSIFLEEEQKEYLLEILNSQVFKYGAISKLLENDEIEEITVIGLGELKPVHIFEKTFGWLKTNLYYSHETTVKNLVNKMSRELGRQLSLQTPNLNACLLDGSRINALISPITFSGPSITIRKFKKKPFTPIDLIKLNTVSIEALAFLWMTLNTDSSLMIAGNTGSGKTTSMNALFYFVPQEERIILTEETPEINLPHKHLIKLNTVENLGIKMQNLIVETLRMRPDRIIVGEIRNQEEVEAFINTLLAGQGKGSYATFHALSSNEALKRLKKLKVMEMDLTSIDLIIIQKRWNKIDLKNNSKKEIRKIIEITEILESQKEVELNTLFKFNYEKNCLEKTNESKKVKTKIMQCFGLKEKELNSELLKRRKFLEKLVEEKKSNEEILEKINKF